MVRAKAFAIFLVPAFFTTVSGCAITNTNPAIPPSSFVNRICYGDYGYYPLSGKTYPFVFKVMEGGSKARYKDLPSATSDPLALKEALKTATVFRSVVNSVQIRIYTGGTYSNEFTGQPLDPDHLEMERSNSLSSGVYAKATCLPIGG